MSSQQPPQGPGQPAKGSLNSKMLDMMKSVLMCAVSAETPSPARHSKSCPGSSSGSSGSKSSSSSSGSNSSSSGMALAPEPLLLKVASLAGTAAKLGRYLTAQGTGDGACEPSYDRYRHAYILEKVSQLCCGALQLNHHMTASQPEQSLARQLQRTGFLSFVCLPAVELALQGLSPSDVAGLMRYQKRNNWIHYLLIQLKELDLLHDALLGRGLGAVLSHYFKILLDADRGVLAVDLLLTLCNLLALKRTAGLAVALVKGGLLQAAAEHACHLAVRRSHKGRTPGGEPMSFLIPTAVLCRAVCLVLDESTSTQMLTTYSALLGDVPGMQACMSPDLLTCMSKSSLDPCEEGIVSVFYPEGPWIDKFSTKQAWEKVCRKVIPALSAACAAFTARSQAQQQRGIFRDLAVSAWTCCNPGCTNMAGQEEVSLALSKCAGCGDARYCSRACQRDDWQRHKPICRAIAQLK